MSELVLTEEQELLRRTAADFVREHAPVARIRRLRDADDPVGFSPELWKKIGELGWPGIVLPEAYGGLALGYADLAVVLQELGAALAPEPFLSTVLLAGNAILLGGTDAQKESLLPRVAAADVVLALAHHEPGARHRPFRVATRAEKAGSGWRLAGVKDLVLDGHVADRIVVSARVAGERDARDGIGLFLIDRQTRGVTVERQQLVDHRSAALVRLDGVEVGADAAVGAPGAAGDVLDRVLDRALVGLSAEMLGGMSRAFETTMAYLRDRKQFGVAIGSFQALKHRAARMFIEVELARSTVMAAARALDEGADDASLLASVAKARLSDGFVQVANEAVQMHGGIGMTDEHDVGFYLKHARAAEILLGDATFHRDRFAALQGF
ncbi:MAG TPA: acyl-CoA dehydrogenase [Candidatus Binatia bacterium]|nr:acyl-CoA dehydrogenase [Candidatus Binatia bacterium]